MTGSFSPIFGILTKSMCKSRSLGAGPSSHGDSPDDEWSGKRAGIGEVRQVQSTGEREETHTPYMRIIDDSEDIDQKLRWSVEPVCGSACNYGVICVKTRESVLAHLGTSLH